MPNWSASMERTYEYYIVDPGTWKDAKKLNGVHSCDISRDSDSETLGSATISVDEKLGECYIRIYMVTIQNGIRERFPLGTYLVQTPSEGFDGKVRKVSLDAYTPLIELKENPPPLGYSILKGENVMDIAYRLVRENVRAPVVKAECSTTLHSDFVANTSDKWSTFITDLIALAKYELSLDELGQVLFAPKQELESLQPVWTYNDDNSSLLYPDITVDHDLYGIPNVVEVIYSNGDDYFYSRVVNDDSNSPISTVKRGREIIYRDTGPSISGIPTQDMIDEYAEQLLKSLSVLEYTISYSHGYCPVRVGDCVRINYSRAGLMNIKAKVISQSIKCDPEAKVTEKAIFTTKLWG